MLVLHDIKTNTKAVPNFPEVTYYEDTSKKYNLHMYTTR